MSRIWREPLVHFLAIGALLFALYALVARGDRAQDTIVVEPGQIDAMTVMFQRTWQRRPTPEETRGLVESYVRDEILYREGVAMKLDRDDLLIRKRVRQKVEFFVESTRGIPEAGDTTLQAYLDAHRERFASPSRVTFRQVFLGPAADADTPRLLAQLKRLGDSPEADNLGRATQLEARMDLASTTDVEQTFGRRFAQALAAMPVGDWRGPVASEYGLHLVRISERVEGRAAVLGEVRELVRRDWLKDDLAATNDRYYEGLRGRYAVRIEDSRLSPAP